MYTSCLKERFAQKVPDTLESHFNEIPSGKERSQDATKFPSIDRSDIHQEKMTKHYCMPLPLKKTLFLPNNRAAMGKCIEILQVKLENELVYYKQYFEFYEWND